MFPRICAGWRSGLPRNWRKHRRPRLKNPLLFSNCRKLCLLELRISAKLCRPRAMAAMVAAKRVPTRLPPEDKLHRNFLQAPFVAQPQRLEICERKRTFCTDRVRIEQCDFLCWASPDLPSETTVTCSCRRCRANVLVTEGSGKSDVRKR